MRSGKVSCDGGGGIGGADKPEAGSEAKEVNEGRE